MIQRIRKGWRTLRENKRAGVSLIVALCAVALIIGLALSLTYSSSLLLARANRKVGRERCYQLAKSFSEVLDGFMDMSDEEILAKGINDSLIHVDFMVGSDDLHIVGIHEDGSETDVFVNGTWAE